MKKPFLFALLLTTGLFAAFLTGFYVGRNANHQTVQVRYAAEPISETAALTSGTEAAASTVGASGPVNLNTATAEELETLPGIGPVLAAEIVAYRTAHGPFSAVEELTNVSGIGEKRLAQLEGLVTVGGDNENSGRG